MIKNIRKAVYEILRDDAFVSAIVTNGSTTRIYPISLPQGITDQSVVYRVLGADSDYHLQGPSGLVETRMQIDSMATTQGLAFDLADLVKDALSGFRGSVPVNNALVHIRGIFHDSGRDLYDSTARLFSSQRDYLIWWVEQFDIDEFDYPTGRFRLSGTGGLSANTISASRAQAMATGAGGLSANVAAVHLIQATFAGTGTLSDTPIPEGSLLWDDVLLWGSDVMIWS